MKKYLPLLLILVVFTGKSFAQFSLDKFLNEKLVKPAGNMELNMEKLMQNATDAMLNKIAIKVVNAKFPDGGVGIKSISNANLVDKEAKKLYDLLKAKLKSRLGKVTKENVVNNVNNNMWHLSDGTTYMLTYSGNLTMLIIMKK